MRSFKEFKEFLEEGLISEDDDKKEEKKESKKDSEKESEKKDKDKKEEKKEKKEEEIVLDRNEGYSFSPKIVFGKSAYDKHMEGLDEDDDEYEEKIKPMVYTFSFGGKYQLKMESIAGNEGSWNGSVKGMPSGQKEQGLVLSTIMDILPGFIKADMDSDLMPGDIDEVYLHLSYSDENQIENYKKMLNALHVPGFKKSGKANEVLKKYRIRMVEN